MKHWNDGSTNMLLFMPDMLISFSCLFVCQNSHTQKKQKTKNEIIMINIDKINKRISYEPE